ncbi:MAG: Peptidase [Parcubacteria group bacterium]|nr:Peptidase [Parcubacteria group bacterium]
MKADQILRGDEGMWPLNMVPKDRLKKLHNVDIDDEWLQSVQRSSVRMNNGGSASFVSGDGLIATNHHVAADILYKLSSEGKDYMRDGFLAKIRKDELKATQLEVNVLWEIEDVTDKVLDAVSKAKNLDQKTQMRRAVIADIEKKSLEGTGMRSDVVTLYNGGKYHLYRYKKYTDIRLVFAPEAAIAGYGGDIDNYEFPRYCLDVTFFRVYENGKPLVSPNHFTWYTGAPTLGQTLFVVGHPGTTDRLTTFDRIKLTRDILMPKTMDYIHRKEVSLQQYAGRSLERARRADDELHSIRNVRKRYEGQLAAIQSPAFLKQLEDRETAIRSAIKKDPALKKLAGNAWDDVKKATETLIANRDEFIMFEGGRAFDTEYFALARTIVRLTDEDTKPNAKRLQEFGDARRASLMDRLYSAAPIYSDLEEHTFTDSLRNLVETIGFKDKDVLKILNGKSVETIAKECISKTKLGSVAERKRLVKGGHSAVKASKDPFIQLASLIDKRARKIRTLIENEVQTVTQDAYGRIAQALFGLYGEALYPDATFTLRLAYGTQVPYATQKVPEPAYTTIGGVFQHGEQHSFDGAWKLPERWEKNRAKLEKNPAAFNFITTHDTHGGNSGSPVITKDKEIVGLLFDGLVETQGGDSFMYMADSKEHTVCVHSEGIYSLLKTIYGADELAKELKSA